MRWMGRVDERERWREGCGFEARFLGGGGRGKGWMGEGQGRCKGHARNVQVAS